MDERTEAGRLADAERVVRVRAGDTNAFGELYDGWFDRVHDLAFRITRDSGAAGDVAQEAFLAAWQQLPKLDRPEVFGGWLLRIARNRALDHLRRAGRSTPTDQETMAVIERTAPSSGGAPAGFRVEDRVATASDPARAAEDDELATLVWGASEALGERDAEVLDLTLRHGLTPAEIADVVGTNRNAANQMVHRARTRLKDAVCARVLWRKGEPECGDLADALAAAGVAQFGAEAVRVATTHASSCDLCTRRQKLRLDPAHLFAAIPITAAPALLKDKVAHALMADGVPMGGSASSAGSGGEAHDREQPADDQRHDDDRHGDGGGGSDGAARPDANAAAAARAGRGRRTLLAIGAGVMALLVALVALVALADRLDRGTVSDRRVAVGEAASATTRPTVSTTTTSSPPAGTEPPVEELLPAAPPVDAGSGGGGGGEPVPEPPPAPATVSVTLSPSSATPTYLRPNAPVLMWSSEGAATVDVSGPGLVASGASGSTVVCPTGTGMWSICVASPGTYTYTVTARDAQGAVVATGSATLTIA